MQHAGNPRDVTTNSVNVRLTREMSLLIQLTCGEPARGRHLSARLAVPYGGSNERN